jgi:hypothetical protein
MGGALKKNATDGIVDFVLNCIVQAKSSAFGCSASRLLQAFRGSKKPPVVLISRCSHELTPTAMNQLTTDDREQSKIDSKLMIFRL